MIDIIRELVRFLVRRRNYWLMPVVLMMVVIGGLLMLTKGSAIAPFIYTLF